jgi:uncharacterized membrane protein
MSAIARLRALRLSGPVAWTAGVGLISVLYMGFVVPLGFGSDETQHAFRAYQLSLGHLFPQVVVCAKHPHLLSCRGRVSGRLLPKNRAGGELSYAFVRVLSRLYGISHHNGKNLHFKPSDYTPLLGVSLGAPATAFAHFENTALYSPINYVPETAVFWFARQLGASVIATLFAARIVAGLVWVGFITAAVALTPRWKWLFSLVVLVPTALSQGAVISADSAALGVIALTSAYAIYLADRGTQLSRREIVALSAVGVVIGLLKFPLVIVLAAIIAIVSGVLGAGAVRRRNIALIALPGVVAAVAWDLASNAYFVPYRNVVYQQSLRAYISQSAQEHHLVSHFYDIPSILWQTAIHGELFRLDEVVGQIGEMGLPEWFGIVWLVLFLVLACGSIDGAAVSRRVRAWIGGSLIVYFLGTALALYLTWTAVGSGQISGMHGRYFTLVLVLAVPLFAGVASGRLRIPARFTAYAVMAITAAAALTTFAYAADHYYGKPPWWVLSRVSSVLF